VKALSALALAAASALLLNPSELSSQEARKDGSQTLRGFTTQPLEIKTLENMKTRWNANMLRLMMRPAYDAKRLKLQDAKEGWKKLLEELPPFLDKAAELKITVVLTLFEVPNDNAKSYRQGKERLSDFWADDSNLPAIVECWSQIGELCKNRPPDSVWFDILNEPLDWKDFPHVARKWPDWSQRVIDSIRAKGLKNPVVVEVGPGGLCWGFKEFPLLKGEGIVYSTHQYQPHVYTHQGISSISNTDLAKAYLATNQPWPGSYSDSGGGLWNKERLLKELEPLIEFQKKHKVRVYISEFGCVRWAPNRDAYVKDCLEIYESFGWDWTFHALNENPIWSPDAEPEFSFKAAQAKETTPTARLLLDCFKKGN